MSVLHSVRSRVSYVNCLLAAVTFLLLPTAVMAFDACYHEFWRDEVQVYLIAAHAPFPEFFSVMHLEGVPFLYHLLVKLLAQFASPLVSLLVAGWLGICSLLFGTYRLLRSICGRTSRSLVITLALGLTYNYAYEFGAVIRQYPLSLGFALLSAGLYRDALRSGRAPYAVMGSVACALGAASSAHGAALCAAIAGAFVLAALLRGQLTWSFLLSPVCTAPVFLLVLYLALPYPDRVPGGHVPVAETNPELFALFRQAIAASFTPQDWWCSSLVGEPSVQRALGVLRGYTWLVFAGAAVALLAAHAQRPLRARFRSLYLFDMLAVVFGWAAVAQIILYNYWGSPRHHLHFSALAIVVALGWIAASRWRNLLTLSAVPYFALEISLATLAFQADRELRFSDTKMHAALYPADARVVTDLYMFYQGILFWRPDLTLRATDQAGARARYTRADTRWHQRVALRPLLQQECREAPDRVFYSSMHAAPADAGCLSLLSAREPPTVRQHTEEQFSLWRVDCACVNPEASEP